MGKPLNILIIEDSKDDVLLLLAALRRNGYDPASEHVETEETMREALRRRPWDVVISDYVMPRFSGLDALEVLRTSGLDLPFIIVSGNIGEDIAVEAMRAGAHDYILKGNLARLVPAVERELREAGVRAARRREEEERIRLSAAIESAADAVAITDPRGAIQYVNPAFEKVTGYSREETLGRDLHLLDSGKHNDESMQQEVRTAFRRGEAWTGRRLQKRKDGSLYYEDSTLFPVAGTEGAVINYVVIKRDVTEKLRLESIAEAVNTMNNIGFVFSGVRHEIGNPINSLQMILSIMRGKLENLSQDDIRRYLERMAVETSKVVYLLNTLKSFNMYERLNLQSIHLPAFMEKFLALVSEDLAVKGVNLTADLGAQAGKVCADPRALQQILLNLLSNAADATEGRDGARIAISAARDADRVRIQVADNGQGIPEDKRKDVFKPFFTTKPHGTGLGLVIVQKMLARMDGTIAIESSLPTGTTVELCLPAAVE